MKSCDTVTRLAVPRIFTRNTGRADTAEETSFISIFKKLGFLTAWISNQGYLGTHETTVSAIASEAEHTIYKNATGNFNGELKIFDEDLLGDIDVYLNMDNKNRMIILHPIGCHWKYDCHYPDRFMKFKPVCAGKNLRACDVSALTNSYDNTILYADDFIGRVIGKVKDMNALVFYISDHGESLGEKGVYLHSPGQKAEEQFKAAMFVWASKRYAARNSEKYLNLQRNRSLKLNHDVIFHSVLDAAGIESSVVLRGKSIFGRIGQ
jgi:KDO II ethanolaminephosphotransferase